ncbi:MAG: hypothetical protein ACRDJ5_10930 [Actinomycetota bacterium]
MIATGSGRRTAALLLAASLVTAGCYRDTSDLTESGLGRPSVSVSFPSVVEGGSVHTATVRIDNPGPGDIPTIVISFSLLGSPREGIEDALIVAGRGARSPSIAGVEPEPVAASEGGTIYRFGRLDEGESLAVRFEVEVPAVRGKAANAVLVYDGSATNRARGTRLETTIR